MLPAMRRLEMLLLEMLLLPEMLLLVETMLLAYCCC